MDSDIQRSGDGIRCLRQRYPGGRIISLSGLVGAILMGAAGCSFVPDPVNPVEWFKGVHGMIGNGKTEEQKQAEAEARRTPMPGADGPFPNLATVPPRPVAGEEPAARLRDRLSEDRGAAWDDDTQMRVRDAERAVPPPLPVRSARKTAPVVSTPDEPAATPAPPPRMPKLTRPPPPPSLGDPETGAPPAVASP